MRRAPRTRGRGVLRVVVVAELLVGLVTAATVTVAYREVDGGILEGAAIEHHAEPPPPRLPDSELNLLVLGVDDRDCEGCGLDGEDGGGSDATILLHVAEGRQAAYGISIPRDTLVDRPACLEDGAEVPAAEQVPWNEAYAVAGPECTAAQLEAVTGIWVDSYVVVDFAGFQDMVDAIGGVEVCVPEPIDDPLAGLRLDAGTHLLDGAQALGYVRQRSSTPNADLGRMKRQQAFLASMANRVLSAGVLARPDRLYRFARALAGSLETSPDLASTGALVRLAGSLRDADLRRIRFVTAPSAEFPRDDPRWGRVRLTAAAEDLWRRVREDEPLGRLGRGSVSGADPDGAADDAAQHGLCG